MAKVKGLDRRKSAPLPAPVGSSTPLLKVRALKMVWHNTHRYRAGDVFTLKSNDDYKPSCMAIVSDETPEHQTLLHEAQAAAHRAIMRGELPKMQPNAADLDEPRSPLAEE